MMGGIIAIIVFIVFMVVFAVYDISHRDPDECGFFRDQDLGEKEDE